MKEETLGPFLVITAKIIGACPESTGNAFRLFAAIFLLFAIICQGFYIVDHKNSAMGAWMEAVAMAVTNMLSFVKLGILWFNKGYIEECLKMLEEDWKKMRDEKYLAIMARGAKISRSFCMAVVISYYSTFTAFVVQTLSKYTPEDPDNFQERELLLKTSYPFDVYHSPTFEVILVLGIIQGLGLPTGNTLGDGLLFALTTHVNGQLDILHDRLRRFSDVRELPDIIRRHQELIHFAEMIELSFKWIGLAEFLSTSLIICAIGYVLFTALESNHDSFTIAKLVCYMFVMQLGSFIYCHTGNTLTEKTSNIRDAAYESNWADLPPETSKILIIIMMRADKPFSLTAGGFASLNYETFVNISRTAASYLSVIRASSE